MNEILSQVKASIIPSGKQARTIKAGLLRGIRMELDLSSQTQLYYGLYEREIHHWLKRLSKDARTCLDIGAAEGETTLYFLMKTRAKVISFEPERYCYESLFRNLELNEFDKSRLEFIPKFVGSQCRLDSLQVESPVFVKMDVEGAEADILRESADFIRHTKTRWLIETHSAELEKECISILKGAGLQPRIVKNAWWRKILPEQRPLEHNRWLVAQ